jgi:hypothetical protein
VVSGSPGRAERRVVERREVGREQPRDLERDLLLPSIGELDAHIE